MPKYEYHFGLIGFIVFTLAAVGNVHALLSTDPMYLPGKGVFFVGAVFSLMASIGCLVIAICSPPDKRK